MITEPLSAGLIIISLFSISQIVNIVTNNRENQLKELKEHLLDKKTSTSYHRLQFYKNISDTISN